MFSCTYRKFVLSYDPKLINVQFFYIFFLCLFRLNTDIAFAKNHHLKSLLVLSGISSEEDIHKAEENPNDPKAYVPDFYLPSLKEFSELLPE